MDAWATVPVLAGRHVRLEPLRAEHADALVRAASDGELWTLRVTQVPSADTVAAYIGKALEDQAAGTALPFLVKDAAGEVVGSTRCFAIDRAVPRLEIGYTWYAARVQRTALNTEAKRLLLGHASGDDGDIAGVAPWPELEGSALVALDALIRLLRVLARHERVLGERMTPAQWRERLLALLDGIVHPAHLSATDQVIIWNVRLPYALMAVLVGLVVTTFAFLGVNMFLSGLHSYGEL